MFDNRNYGYDFEPSLVDEILTEFSDKMKNVLLDSVKADIEQIKKENDQLKKENEKLKYKCQEVYNLQHSLEYERINLQRLVKREYLSELMKDFKTIMYMVSNIGKLKPKCELCNDERQIVFLSPTGKQFSERCECNKKDKFYIPKQYELYNFELNKDKNKIDMWYRKQTYNDEEYFTHDTERFASVIFNKEMPYDSLKEHNTFFKDEEDCQSYCDWLNRKDIQPESK